VPGTVCLIGDPVDWFTFTIEEPASGYGSISLANLGDFDNDIAVYDDPGEEPLYEGNQIGSMDEHLDIDYLDHGQYYIAVEAMGYQPQGDRSFLLDLNISEIVVECDDQDGNNSWEEAFQISLVDVETGTVCFPTDPDWFRFDVPPEGIGGTIELGAYDLHDNDLALFGDPTAPPIAESAQPGFDNEEIDVGVLEAGTYYIRATASSTSPGINQPYVLSTYMSEEPWGPVDLFVHCHIVRQSDGSNPATDEERVDSHIAWADEFYSRWIDGSVNLVEISYIDNTAWLALTTGEAEEMFEQYGDASGALHVFYVNSTPDMPGAAAYAFMECMFELQDHTVALIVMSDYADTPTLAHEMGHACGLLADMYLLDFFTCEQITYCEDGPSDIFCLESDATYGNLMYWPIGSDIDSYWISDTDLEMATGEIDSQGENIWHFHVNWPDAFFEP